jgi:hypothetical protein
MYPKRYTARGAIHRTHGIFFRSMVFKTTISHLSNSVVGFKCSLGRQVPLVTCALNSSSLFPLEQRNAGGERMRMDDGTDLVNQTHISLLGQLLPPPP